MAERGKKIPLGIALIPVVFLVLALSVTIGIFRLSPHIPLICAAAVAAGIAIFFKHPWTEIHEGMVQGITLAMGAILILMIVGTMIGTWIIGGVVPTMIYYGLKVCFWWPLSSSVRSYPWEQGLLGQLQVQWEWLLSV